MLGYFFGDRDSTSRKQLGFKFFISFFLCIFLMIVDYKYDHLDRFRQKMSVVIYPIQMIVDYPLRKISNINYWLTSHSNLIEENNILKSENLLNRAALQRLDSIESENNRLRSLLQTGERLEERVLVAETLKVDLDPYRQRFLINHGLNDEVYLGQAVIDSQGIVGQIIRVNAYTSEVLLISDLDHAIPVVLDRNGLRTIAIGTGDSSNLLLPYLTNSSDIKVGDLVVTSGLGGVFPSGYPVGHVTEINIAPERSFSRIIIAPAAQLDRDTEVILIWPSIN